MYRIFDGISNMRYIINDIILHRFVKFQHFFGSLAIIGAKCIETGGVLLYNHLCVVRQAIVEPRYGLGFCLFPSALHSFLKYSKYSCKFVASPNEKMQKHKLCDLPFRKITDISKSQNAVILTYYKR